MNHSRELQLKEALARLKDAERWRFRLNSKGRGYKRIVFTAFSILATMIGIAVLQHFVGYLTPIMRVLGWVAVCSATVCGIMLLALKMQFVAFLLAAESDRSENLVQERIHDLATMEKLHGFGKDTILDAKACVDNAIDRLQSREMLTTSGLTVGVLTILQAVSTSAGAAFVEPVQMGALLALLALACLLPHGLQNLARYKYRRKVLMLALEPFQRTSN